MKEHTAPLPAAALPQALDLCRRVFLEFEAPDYGLEGTDAFLRFLDPAQMERMAASGLLAFFGHWSAGVLTGTGAVRDRRHISLLFVEGRFHRRGIGSALLEAMTDFCRRAGTREITVNASPFAAGFYQNRGFRPLDGEQRADGIRFIPMARVLKRGNPV